MFLNLVIIFFLIKDFCIPISSKSLTSNSAKRLPSISSLSKHLISLSDIFNTFRSHWHNSSVVIFFALSLSGGNVDVNMFGGATAGTEATEGVVEPRVSKTTFLSSGLSSSFCSTTQL